MADFTIELACCEFVLLNEIAMPEMKQRQNRGYLRFSPRSSERDSIDWKKRVN